MTNLLWERQDTDTDASFKAFTIYLYMHRRSLQKAADQYYSKKDANRTQFTKWSSANNWQERVRAYEDYIAELDRADYEEKRMAIRVKRQQIVDALQGLLGLVMKEYREQLDPQSLSSLSSAASRILDQSRQEFDDLPTTRTEHTGKDGGAIIIQSGQNMDDL
jgi:hypothetical protein